MDKIFLVLLIISSKCFCSDVKSADEAVARPPVTSFVPIRSVREIPGNLIRAGTVLVVDADETVAMLTIMANTFEHGRQHKEAMTAAQLRAYREVCADPDSPLHNPAVASQTDADLLASPELRGLAKEVGGRFDAAQRAYELTEPHWSEFLARARAAGAKVIVVSSRRFFDKEDSAIREPARVEFFERLGFARADLLYSGSADSGRKDVTLHRYLQDNPALSISIVVFVDNLREHCDEITGSRALSVLDRHAFEHNAYAEYFKTHQHILIEQMKAALHGKVLTDLEVLDLIRAREKVQHEHRRDDIYPKDFKSWVGEQKSRSGVYTCT